MDWYLERLGTYGDSVAFQEAEEDTTYSELLLDVRETKEHLQQAGIGTGTVVIISGASNAQLFSKILAVMHIGAIAVPLTELSPISISVAIEIAQGEYQLSTDSAEVVKLPSSNSLPYPLIQSLRREKIGGLILFSSGSTGVPKAILYDSETVLEKFKAIRQPIKALLFLMMDHFGGLNTIFAITSCGGQAISLSDRSVETVCSAVERHQVKVLPVTPSFIRLLMISGAHKRFDLKSIEKITFGTEPMTQSTLDQLRQEFPGVELQQTYGLTEVGVLRSKSRPDGTLWMKIGGEGFEWKIKNETLWIRSQFQMRGYLNADADIDEDGFFNTQDEVMLDGDYVQILGRVSDIINVGGEKVYPTEIENFIEELDNIQDVVAYGEFNALLGQVIAVDIVLKEDEALDVLRKRIRESCRVSLGRNKVPSKIRIVEELAVSSRQKKTRKNL
jgi:acyl-CoA synthetase (AMP-forming)/AMP-acid ligase II